MRPEEAASLRRENAQLGSCHTKQRLQKEREKAGGKIIPSCLWRGQAAAGANYSDMLTISTLEQREKGTRHSQPLLCLPVEFHWWGRCLPPLSHLAEKLDSNYSTSTGKSVEMEIATSYFFQLCTFAFLTVNNISMYSVTLSSKDVYKRQNIQVQRCNSKGISGKYCNCI